MAVTIRKLTRFIFALAPQTILLSASLALTTPSFFSSNKSLHPSIGFLLFASSNLGASYILARKTHLLKQVQKILNLDLYETRDHFLKPLLQSVVFLCLAFPISFISLESFTAFIIAVTIIINLVFNLLMVLIAQYLIEKPNHTQPKTLNYVIASVLLWISVPSLAQNFMIIYGQVIVQSLFPLLQRFVTP